MHIKSAVLIKRLKGVVAPQNGVDLFVIDDDRRRPGEVAAFIGRQGSVRCICAEEPARAPLFEAQPDGFAGHRLERFRVTGDLVFKGADDVRRI